MLKPLILLIPFVVLMCGCGAKQYSLSPIEQIAPIEKNKAILCIISPNEQNLPGVAFHPYVNYEYFLDCLESKCKIAKMHALQYATTPVDNGKHTLYVRLAADGFANKLIVMDDNETARIDFEAKSDSRSYIRHELDFSMKTLLFGPLTTYPSTLKEIDETNGRLRIQDVLDAKSVFGTKILGFGEKAKPIER